MRLPLTGGEAVDAVLESFPDASSWLARRGVICTECGEVFWGTLAQLAEYRGLGAKKLDELLVQLNAFLASNP